MENLFEPGETWLYLADEAPSPLTDRMWALDKEKVAVRFVRGRRMGNTNELYHEWAAALQFPYYFNDNAGGFSECLADLDWLDANGYVIVVLDAGDVLKNDDDFKWLLETLSDVAEGWSEEDEFRPARPFKVILQEHGGTRAEKLRERCARLGYPAESFAAG